jgi:dTDP-4-dehydrorhamnose 3,5-epimerase
VGVKHIVRSHLGDNRGWLERMFCSKSLSEAGWEKPISQINRTFTKERGTVRGMHYQNSPHAECKFVSCLNGKVFDVAVDLRKDSSTFLQSFGVELSEENKESLLIPEGVAHGFQTFSDDVMMLYFHSAAYMQGSEDSVHPEDPLLQIQWPLEVRNLSDRDKAKIFLSGDFEGIIV